MARLLFFGKLSDLAGGRAMELALPQPAMSVEAVIEALGGKDAALAVALRQQSVRCAVNEVVTGRETIVADKDEIAFLPPVSGG